jgi:phage portal protein BeeE
MQWPWTKKAPVRAVSEEPMSPIFTIAGQPVRFVSSGAVMTAEEAQRKIPQLYRVTHLVASSAQMVPWKCIVDPIVPRAEQAQVSTLKAINSMLNSPNDNFTAENLRYWMTLNLMLYSRVHFKVGIGTAGHPNAIYPLATKFMKGVPNNRGTIDQYIYGEGTSQEQKYPSKRKAKAGESYAAEISFPSVSGLIEYNKAPAAVESLMIPLAIITCLMQRALDTASGHPNIKYVVTSDKTLTKQQVESLKEHLESSGPGQEGSGNVLFLYNTKIEVHTLDNKMGDIHSKIPLDDMTRIIAGVFGVPVALLGLSNADAAKYGNNYQQSRLALWQDTVVPTYIAPMAAGLTASLCPYGAKIAFDYDAVPALWEGRAMLGQTLSHVNFLTSDEKRAILGFKPDPDLPKLIGSTTSTPIPTGDGKPAAEPDEEDDDDDKETTKEIAPFQPRLVTER